MSSPGNLNLWALPAALGLVVAGVWLLATLDAWLAAVPRRRRQALAQPWRDALRHLVTEFRWTEAPDKLLWRGAPLLLVALAFAALLVMPLAPHAIGADLSVGVVYFTAMFAFGMVAVFAAGWGANSKYPLIAAYRFVGLMLAYEMPFAITIIAVALPAKSLALGTIVARQQEILWNIALQPLGFLLYCVCALGVAFWGPFDVVSSPDVAGGVEAELSGAPLLVWRFGRYALLLAVAALAVPLFLGGGAGPWLAPVLWTILKVMAIAGAFLASRHWLPRVRLDRFMRQAWILLIPLSLVNLFVVGLIMLLAPGFFGGAS